MEYLIKNKGVDNMKKSLNLFLDENLIKDIKHIAISENTTVSKLVEDYIKAINTNKDIIKVMKTMTDNKSNNKNNKRFKR